MSHRPTLQTVSLAQAGIDELAARLQANENSDSRDRDQLKAARLCRQIDRLRDADDHFTQLLARHENQAWLWLEAGQLANKLGDTAQATERFQRATQDEGLIGQDALHQLALTQLDAGEAASAGHSFFRLTRRNAARPEGWAGMIVCATVARRPKLLVRARMAYAERFGTKERTAHLCRIWLHAAALDATGELNHLLQPLEAVAPQTNPQEKVITNTADPIATTPEGPLRFEDVVAWSQQTLQQSAEAHPDRADTHYHLAVCHDVLGQKEQSQQAAEQAVSINPRYQRAIALVDKLQKTYDGERRAAA